MDKSQLQFKLNGVEGELIWQGDRVNYISDGDLEYGAYYEVEVNGWDLAGNRMQTKGWSFWTDNTGFISGVVEDGRGHKLEGIKVTVEDGNTTMTREDGYFKIDSEAGERTLIISGEGFETMEVTVLVRAGRTEHIDKIVLSREEEGGLPWYTIWLIVIAIALSVGLVTFIGIHTQTKRSNPYPTEE
ncbi:MAG: carboxypeptidase regulatory-like domain-containing protein [Thermoplasmatota archaeon]